MKIAVLGRGVMGKETIDAAIDAGLEVVGSVEPLSGGRLEDLPTLPDVIIDFSHPDVTDVLCEFCTANGINAVVACTGHTREQLFKLKTLSEIRGIVVSPNFSVGINALSLLAKNATRLLKKEGFDVELTEAHHRRKADAPSGTARFLLECLDPDGRAERVFDRSERGRRTDGEIGVSVVRGGGLCGKHEILFLGESETVSLVHTALDRSVFARGALKAAIWVSGREAGYYSMSDVLMWDKEEL